MRKPTKRQQRFALEYAKDGKGAAAARRAGYSADSAKQIASKLLTKANVQAAVAAATDKCFEALDLELGRIVRELARVGVSDIRQLFDEDGHLIPMHLLPHDVAKAVASIKVLRTTVDVDVQVEGDKTTTTTERTETVELKFWDKIRALEALAKLKGLMQPQVSLEAGDTWEQVLVRMVELENSGEAPELTAAGAGHRGHHGSDGRVES